MKNKIKIWNKVDFRGFQSPEVREKKSKSQEIHICGFHCDDN
jgi:hypothetical protein